MTEPTLDEMLDEEWRVFHAVAEPFVKMKLRVLEPLLPTLILYPDGRMEREYPPGAQKLLDEIDLAFEAAIQQAAKGKP